VKDAGAVFGLHYSLEFNLSPVKPKFYGKAYETCDTAMAWNMLATPFSSNPE